jgi:hypothetical protein
VAVASAAGVRVGPWVTKKRLGMTGPLSGGGGGSGRQVSGGMGISSGASIKLSPASALARDVQEADDMF